MKCQLTEETHKTSSTPPLSLVTHISALSVLLSCSWMSETTGRTWTRQTPSSSSRALPARAYMDMAADSQDNLFVVGGRDATYQGGGYCDVWRSIDQGRNWVRRGALPIGEGGRFSAALLIYYSKILRLDVLTYIGGISRVEQGTGELHNDIWISTTQGQTWTELTDQAPFSPRDNFNAEVSPDGYLLIESGYNYQETYNDAWISADGGYTWGTCADDAPFSDRRFQMTVLDQKGYLWTVGGEEYENGYRGVVNDVWRSGISFSSTPTTGRTGSLTSICPGVVFPTCTPGLSCLPSTVTFTQSGAATCPQLKVCDLPPVESSSSSSGGLSGAYIALIVILVVGVVGVGGFFAYRKFGTAAMSYVREDGLLGSAQLLPGQLDSSTTTGRV